MILRHVNGECFSLQKLVIRAPSTGYTSPYVFAVCSASPGYVFNPSRTVSVQE